MTRYSQLYVERGHPEQDSERARVRLYTFFENNHDNIYQIVRTHLEAELGIEIPKYGLKKFFISSAIRDLLDTITEVAICLRNSRPHSGNTHSERWLLNANRIFSEENLAYRIGDDGIVHPYPDAEFEINRASALSALDRSQFAEAQRDFEEAFRHLRNGEGKQALRMMFPAVETAAKVLFPGAFARLMPNEVERYLKPRLEQRYTGNEPAKSAGRLLLESFKKWIEAAQPYRHGQEQQALAEPPQDFVIAHLSAGATYLRWMIELCET